MRQTDTQQQTNYIYEVSDRQTNKKKQKHQSDEKSACHKIVGIIRKTLRVAALQDLLSNSMQKSIAIVFFRCTDKQTDRQIECL